jgi:hypothetical protein
VAATAIATEIPIRHAIGAAAGVARVTTPGITVEHRPASGYDVRPMLDLKAKLAAAGLVTQAELDAQQLAKDKRKAGRRRKGGAAGTGPGPGPVQVLAALAGRPRGEQYDGIRRVVDKARLDAAGPVPPETARPFHFSRGDGTVGRVFVEGPTADALAAGRAKVVAFMSHHGLAHAVLDAAIAQAVGRLFPEWVG